VVEAEIDHAEPGGGRCVGIPAGAPKRGKFLMTMLRHEDLLALRDAVISADLGDSRAALLVGIDLRITAGLAIAPRTGDQALLDLDAFNRMQTLDGDTPPLVTWLRNAHALAAPRREASVFESALVRVCATMMPVQLGSVEPRADDGTSSPWWLGHVQSASGRRVFRALSDPKYDFRTVVGLAKAANLSEPEVKAVLMQHSGLVRETRNARQQPIFTLAPPLDDLMHRNTSGVHTGTIAGVDHTEALVRLAPDRKRHGNDT